VQIVHPQPLLERASRDGVCVRLRHRVGEHAVAGTTLAWVWRATPAEPAPNIAAFTTLLDTQVHIGFERTYQQDAAFGIRQLVDIACKALSPAVNDPYTAVQAVDHLAVIFCALARQSLGTHVEQDAHGNMVIIPGRRFAEYLAVMCGLIRRYGSHEPTVSHALLRLLRDCAAVTAKDPERWAAIDTQARLVVSDAERDVARKEDLDLVHVEAEQLHRTLQTHS
jgi:uncharacterized membrane protein